MGKKNKLRYGTCTKDCYGSCVFEGVWDDSAPEYKLISADPLKDHPFTNGFFCPKFLHREKLLYHKDRLKKPLIRDGPKSKNNFKTASIESVLNIISEKIKKIEENNSMSSILGAFYAGNSGLISRFAPLRFFGKLGTTITSGGICNEGGTAGLTKLFGTYSITNPFQLINNHNHLIVIWGCNLSVSNIHAYYLVKQAIRNGAELVVVDSRRTQIAEQAHYFLHIYPGTEHLLVKLILNELITRNAHDKKFLTDNVNSYRSIFFEVNKIDKEKLLSQIGVKFQKVQDFVKLLVKFKHHTLFNIGFGIQKDFFGGRIVRAIALIQILLGNIGKPGTGIIYSQSDFMDPLIKPLKDYITQIKPDSNLKEIPLIKLGTELHSGKYQLLFIYNFNPASSLPNQNQLRRAFSRKDLFVVVLDMFLNETTKYADIVIPAKLDLETDDFISPYYIPSLSINNHGPCPYQDCMSNYEFFRELACKIDKGKIFQDTEKKIFKHCLRMLPSNILKDIKTKGYFLLFNKSSLPFEKLKFPTYNNHIQALEPHFSFGERILKQRLDRKENEFLLITPSHSNFLHSQLNQIHAKFLEDFNKFFLTLKDIKRLKLTVGDKVLVFNEYGSGIYILKDMKILKTGTALIYSGGSSTLDGRVNVNFFTPEDPEELGLSGAYNSALVRVTKKDA